jgi:hypothetical protein
MCSGTSCYTPQTLTCSKNMCKKCCERAPGVCMYKGHNGGQRPYSSSSNPAHLRRPVPAIPLRFAEPAFDPQLFASPSNTPTPELPASTDGFTFRKAVLPDLLEDTQRRWAERDVQALETVSRAENERRIKHSVFLAVYLEENMPPDTIPLQGINTWPTLCLAQILSILNLHSTSNAPPKFSTPAQTPSFHPITPILFCAGAHAQAHVAHKKISAAHVTEG